MIDRTKDVGRLNLKTGTVDMTHGAGGLASVQLIEAVFAKHFSKLPCYSNQIFICIEILNCIRFCKRIVKC